MRAARELASSDVSKQQASARKAAATRKRMLDRLAADRLPFIGFHLPWPGHGIVERQGSAYRFVPL